MKTYSVVLKVVLKGWINARNVQGTAENKKILLLRSILWPHFVPGATKESNECLLLDLLELCSQKKEWGENAKYNKMSGEHRKGNGR